MARVRIFQAGQALDETRKPTGKARRRSACAGVTLVELMVTLAVAAILTMIAAPSFTQLMDNNRASGVAMELVASLNLARSEAARQGMRVSLCKTADADATTPACATSGGWQSGWMLFTDNMGTPGVIEESDAGHAGNPEYNDVRLRIQQSSYSGVTITGAALFANSVTFERDTSLYNPSSTYPDDTKLTICAGHAQRVITIDNAGIVQVSKGSC